MLVLSVEFNLVFYIVTMAGLHLCSGGRGGEQISEANISFNVLSEFTTLIYCTSYSEIKLLHDFLTFGLELSYAL